MKRLLHYLIAPMVLLVIFMLPLPSYADSTPQNTPCYNYQHGWDWGEGCKFLTTSDSRFSGDVSNPRELKQRRGGNENGKGNRNGGGKGKGNKDRKRKRDGSCGRCRR